MPRGPLTEEQKQVLRERMAAARAAKAERATAVAERPPEDDEAEPTSEGILSELAGLFQQASSKKAGRDKAVNEALDILGRLDPTKYPDIADNPAVEQFVTRVQSARLKSMDVPPGTIIGTGIAAQKKPWTWADLNKSINLTEAEVTERAEKGEVIFPWVIYMPMTNAELIWNGLRVFFRARQRVKVCKVFVDLYEESLNQTEFAEHHAAWLMNTPGAPVHRDYFTTNAPRMKALNQGSGEYYRPGEGVIDLSPSPDLVALAREVGGSNEEAA